MLPLQNFIASSTIRDHECRNMSLLTSGCAMAEELDIFVFCGSNLFRRRNSRWIAENLREDFGLNAAALTFQSDHQRHFQLELLAGFGDTIGYDGTVHNPTKDVYKDCFNLQERNQGGNEWGPV